MKKMLFVIFILFTFSNIYAVKTTLKIDSNNTLKDISSDIDISKYINIKNTLLNNNLTDNNISVNLPHTIIKSNELKVDEIIITNNFFKDIDKDIIFEIVNNDNKLIYDLKFKGKNENFDKDLNISMDIQKLEHNHKFYGLLKDDNALLLDFKHVGKLPSVADIKVYVGDKGYNENDKINIYYTTEKNDKIESYKKDVIVDSKLYIEFSTDHCSNYIITKNSINDNKWLYTKKKDINYFLVFSVFIISVLISIVIIKKMKLKRDI